MINETTKLTPLETLIGLAALYFTAKAVDSLIEPNNTVNYILKYRGRTVYHGITYEDRIESRLAEHHQKGRIFDECVCDYPKSRSRAMVIERKRIDRDCPKYNNHHNWKYSY